MYKAFINDLKKIGDAEKIIDNFQFPISGFSSTFHISHLFFFG